MCAKSQTEVGERYNFRKKNRETYVYTEKDRKGACYSTLE